MTDCEAENLKIEQAVRVVKNVINEIEAEQPLSTAARRWRLLVRVGVSTNTRRGIETNME